MSALSSSTEFIVEVIFIVGWGIEYCCGMMGRETLGISTESMEPWNSESDTTYHY